ncbi:WD repeat-containing protein 87-like [Hyaena hyaena]|uniref:WD repeat-containing protein 87-like n=1 Tax=Hyaena hyaena TaxID=95912 RepID=UPI001924609E|nr:WD repeat-containing protein 87-like [Hyaena hyaena]
MMSVKCWRVAEMAPSPRLIPEWKDLSLLINNVLKDLKAAEKPKNQVIVLSDWPETLYKTLHHPQSKPFICFYSIDINYFVSLNWVEPDSKQIQAVLWIQKKDTEAGGKMEKMKFRVMDQVPPIEVMVHTGSYHMLVAYCGDMHLWLFGDHHRAFTSLGTVPCHFSISCLCYDPETEVLLSGTLGAVVTWLILPNGRDLRMAQTVPMSGHELVQGLSLNGPQGSLLALCENKVRVFTHQGQGQLKEIRKFTPTGSSSSVTCSFTCVSQGYFYAGNKDGEIHAWGLDRGNFLHSFQAHSSSVICVHSRPEIHTLLTAGREGTVREWNLAVGNLLRQLDIGEGLRQLQFIDNTTFFCQTTHTFSLHHLPCFYSLFNVCGSAPEQVRRVCCGRNWTRILCATKDGLLRFLSPVTGDLLVLTWPLLVMDKAVAWAYDPDKEELFVATGGAEVLVFDAMRSPCTAKYVVCTSVNSGDRVNCLAYAQSHLGMGLVGLMFCGHGSGMVRILSHYSHARIEKPIHSGAVLALSTLEGPQENSLLCSYGMDNTVYLTEALLQKNRVTLQSISKILCGCPLQHVVLLPGSVGAITDNHCWRLWHYQDFLKSSESKRSSMFKETKCLHQCAITSFDVCSSLKLFVTGGIDGSVRIWDFHGRLITELDSALHFGPLCFANNRGDLLLTFNQSLYLVSCLKLLPPAKLIHLAILNNADEIEENPKLFLPSFFFSFEVVLVPKFVYLGQGLQELQGLEALVNKRIIAFDNTVPHVVEEERHMSTLIQVKPKLRFLEDKDIAFSTPDLKHNRPPHVVPAQLWLAGWDGLNPYHKLHGFFGKGQQWPFAPDGYIPNSVIRACLWPNGTPVFLRHDLSPSYLDTDWDMTEPIRYQTLSPMPPLEENISNRERDKSKWWKRTFYDVPISLVNRNWAGRKLDERLLNNLIEAILSLTIYCSVDQYKTYISALAQIFATYQVSPRLCSETVSRLLEDTLHSNSCIRELAWEGLDRLDIMSHLFAVPLSLGLMDSDENVRAKALYLMIRVIGIQSKSMLVGLLKKQTLQKMQQEFIGEASLHQLLGIQAKDIQNLLTQVEQQLNENLTLSHRDQQPPFSLDISMAGVPETLVKRRFTPEEIFKRKKRMTYIQEKRERLIKKNLRVSRKKRETELIKFSSVLVPSEHEGEQREAKKSELIDKENVALEPELPLSTFSPAKSQEEAESKEVLMEATEATEATEEGRSHMTVTEAVEATQVMKAIDQRGMKDYGEIFPKLQRQELKKRLWKRAVGKSHKKVAAKVKEKDLKVKQKDLKDISETTADEPKEKVMQIAEQEKDTRKKHGKSGRGLAGTSRRKGGSDTRSWRDDIYYLATSRIASSHSGMLRDLGQELVDLAQVMLAPQEPSWDLFQEICPLLKDSSELEERVVEEPSIITEKEDKEIAEEEVTELGGQKDKKTLKRDKAFPEDGEIAEGERKLSKPEEKLIQGKEKLTQDMEKLAHEKEKIAWEERLLAYPQKELTKEEQKEIMKLVSEEEEEIEETEKVFPQKEKRAMGGEKQEREEHDGKMEKKSQVKEEKALKKRLTQNDSELAKEKRHIAKKEKAIARKGIGIIKRKEKTEEEREIVEEEELSEEERELAYDIRTKEMGVAKKKRKRTNEERIQESLGEEEEESLGEEEGESLGEEEVESLGEEEEESLGEEEAESLGEEEVESLGEEEEEILGEEEEEEMEKIEKKKEEKEERQKDEERLMEVILPEEEVLKTELSKEEVSLSKLALDKKKKGTARRKMSFKKERLLDGKRDLILRDKVLWPTVLKSPFKTPLPVAPEKQSMPWKVLGDHLDLKGQKSQLPGAHPKTSYWGRQEHVLLEKARDMFLQVSKAGLQTQIPEDLHRPESHLSDIIRKPQKSEHKCKGDMWKWFLKYPDSLVGKIEGRALGPVQVPTPSLTSVPAERPRYSEASFSDEEWIKNALVRLEAGEQLSKNSFYRLNQLLRNFTSKGYLKWMHLYNLKAIAKHLRKNLAVSHADISQPYKDGLSPKHLKVIPPIRRKEKESQLEPFPIDALPIPSPIFPSTTKRIRVPKAINWHVLGEPYRSARVQQLSNALKEMETQHFYPAAREIFTGAHASVDKQTLALMFQKDLWAFKGKNRPLTLPKLKKPQPISKKKEKLPQWEKFVALYYVLRMLQQRYAEDHTTWMEQFYQLMDLYQFKSPQIQRLLLQLLQREALQPQETIYKKALKTKELVLGERLFCGLFCGHSHAPEGPLKFHHVVPLPGKCKVHTVQPVGIAQYGFLELAWKSLPQVSPYLVEKLPNISTPSL